MKKRGLPSEILTEIIQAYGHTIAEFGAVESGYRNISHRIVTVDGQSLNFILYKQEPQIVTLIKRTNALGAHVALSGLPVRRPVDPRIIRVGDRYGSLYGYLDGETIPWEAYTMKHIKLLGYGLAKFHTAATTFQGDLPDVEGVCREIYERITQYVSKTDNRQAIHHKLGLSVTLPSMVQLFDAAKKLPGRIPLHMDFVRSNLLFGKTNPQVDNQLCVETVALSGIIDLEKAAFGHPLFDIARTLAFLLVDCPKPEDKIRRYFLDSGYRKRGQRDVQPINCLDMDLLESLITLFLLYDWYKFLHQNPYESLSLNHHYRRTVDLLRARKVLQ